MLDYLFSLVKYIFITLLNFLIKAIAAIIGTIAKLLPISPFIDTNVSFLQNVEYIEYIEWLIPISSIISVTGLFLAAFLAYYLIRIIMKYLKMV